MVNLINLVQRMFPRLNSGIWRLMALLLSLTSVPLFSMLAGGSMVAPAAGGLALLLVLTAVFPFLWRRGAVPRQSLPLLGFASAVVISGALALFLPIPPFRDVNLLRSEVKEALTLVVGISVYLVAALYPRRDEHLSVFFRWMNWGALIVLAWSIVQVVAARSLPDYPQWMWKTQDFFSVQGLYRQRLTGLAFEPSWLAHQLNMIYLPYWLGATLSGYSAHRWRIFGKIRFENILLLGGLFELWFSLSRIGLLSFLVMVAYLLVLGSLRLLSWARQALTRRVNLPVSLQRIGRALITFGLIVALLVVYLGMFAGAGVALSRSDPRMASLFEFKALFNGSLLDYANKLVFAERIVFWQTGWEVFNDYPLTGVGLGNIGFFFSQKMPAFGYSLAEVSTLLYHSEGLSNAKSLWTRLLAETGMLGFACFVTWLLVLWATGRGLARSPDRLYRTLGLMGQLIPVGLLIEGFSIDSLALPYYWLGLGLVTAAYTLLNRRLAVESVTP
jgi:hypothetical protein